MIHLDYCCYDATKMARGPGLFYTLDTSTKTSPKEGIAGVVARTVLDPGFFGIRCGNGSNSGSRRHYQRMSWEIEFSCLRLKALKMGLKYRVKLYSHALNKTTGSLKCYLVPKKSSRPKILFSEGICYITGR